MKKGEIFIVIKSFYVFYLTDIITFTVNKIFRIIVWIRHEIIEFIEQMRQIFGSV